jgi:hypothetical protein
MTPERERQLLLSSTTLRHRARCRVTHHLFESCTATARDELRDTVAPNERDRLRAQVRQDHANLARYAPWFPGVEAARPRRAASPLRIRTWPSSPPNRDRDTSAQGPSPGAIASSLDGPRRSQPAAPRLRRLAAETLSVRQDGDGDVIRVIGTGDSGLGTRSLPAWSGFWRDQPAPFRVPLKGGGEVGRGKEPSSDVPERRKGRASGRRAAARLSSTSIAATDHQATAPRRQSTGRSRTRGAPAGGAEMVDSSAGRSCREIAASGEPRATQEPWFR